MTELARTIEALLFIAPEPLEVATLQDITEESPAMIARALDEIATRHAADTGLELAEVAGGWALRTRADLAPACDRLPQNPKTPGLLCCNLKWYLNLSTRSTLMCARI